MRGMIQQVYCRQVMRVVGEISPKVSSAKSKDNAFTIRMYSDAISASASKSE